MIDTKGLAKAMNRMREESRLLPDGTFRLGLADAADQLEPMVRAVL